MTSQPESTLPASPAGASRKFKVRRAPKYVPFIIAGALAGVVTAGIFTFLAPPSEEFTPSTIFGFFTVLMLIPGAILGAIAALIIDRQSLRHSKTLVAQQLPDEDSNAEAETA